MKLESKLVIASVGKLLNPLLKQIAATKTLDIDLSRVKNIDSAGIAFLLELKSEARQKNCLLTFSNSPDIVSRLCQLYQVTL